MLSYRGYGKSEGHASEIGKCTAFHRTAGIALGTYGILRADGFSGIRVDVSAALEYIKSHPILGETKIVVSSHRHIGPYASDPVPRIYSY